jgi:hypothetical protein
MTLSRQCGKLLLCSPFEIIQAIENAARGKFGDSPPAALSPTREVTADAQF